VGHVLTPVSNKTRLVGENAHYTLVFPHMNGLKCRNILVQRLMVKFEICSAPMLLTFCGSTMVQGGRGL
jgi:hypothetical protein